MPQLTFLLDGDGGSFDVVGIGGTGGVRSGREVSGGGGLNRGVLGTGGGLRVVIRSGFVFGLGVVVRVFRVGGVFGFGVFSTPI